MRQLYGQRIGELCCLFCRFDIHEKIAISGKMPNLIAVITLTAQNTQQTIAGLKLKNKKIPRSKFLWHNQNFSICKS